jgi:hypothetical protein
MTESNHRRQLGAEEPRRIRVEGGLYTTPGAGNSNCRRPGKIIVANQAGIDRACGAHDAAPLGECGLRRLGRGIATTGISPVTAAVGPPPWWAELRTKSAGPHGSFRRSWHPLVTPPTSLRKGGSHQALHGGSCASSLGIMGVSRQIRAPASGIRGQIFGNEGS